MSIDRTVRGRLCIAVILGIATIAPRSAFGQEELFTPRHVARLRAVRSAAMSPDGRRIAYSLLVQRDPYADEDEGEFEDGPAWMELHLVDVESGRSRPFVTGEVNVGRVDWTPDGSGISFTLKRGSDEHVCLYVIPVDGGEARRVLKHETDIGDYSWSPDGEQVAFLAQKKEDKEKKKLKDKGFAAEVYEEDLQNTYVWIARPDSQTEPRRLDLPGSANAVHWSPAGDRLAVVLAPTPSVDDRYMRQKVHVVDPETGGIAARIDNPGKLGSVRWSPDGRHLAMISAADLNDPAAGRLMAAPGDGGALRDLIPGYEGHVASIAWQDADTIMFIGDEGVSTVLGKVDVDAGGRKTLVGHGDVILSGLTLARDGMSGAMLGESAGHPSDVFYMAHGDDAPRRLTDSNPWLSDMRFAKQEVVEFNARDGLDLQGILIHPLDEEGGIRYPLILYVHGGPEAHEQNGWLTGYGTPGQVAAARGFAVFYPNYRGSTGRGVEFSKLSQGDEAGKEFDDLVDAVEHLVAAGLVDRDKVGITGGSYGGYASGWGATALTDHFAASVMFVGISDAISKKGTTDIPNEDYLVHTRYHLWDDRWEFALERSPIYHVAKARTPILILHGKNDPRVHPGQSMELYRHLKTIGKTPVRLVWYPGEGHGNRRAANRLDYNLRMLRWMEHYLKGPGGAPPPLEVDYGFEDDVEEDDSPGDTGDGEN